MIQDPAKIEERSFEIIRSELAHEVSEEYEPVVVRVIHTTADFEYADILKFRNNPLSVVDRIKNGCRVYADTSMICAGVSKALLKKNNCEIYSLVSDKNIAEEAAKRGVTRSIVAMEHAVCDPETHIFLIGNAPTALYTLVDHINNRNFSPVLVVGVPVGFVGARESKEELAKCDVPSIYTEGRKGGSTVAVAIMNTMLKMI